MGDYIDAINHRDPRFNPHEVCAKYEIKDLDDLPNKPGKESDIGMLKISIAHDNNKKELSLLSLDKIYI